MFGTGLRYVKGVAQKVIEMINRLKFGYAGHTFEYAETGKILEVP